MKNEKVARSWGVAAAIIAAVISIAAAAVTLWSLSQPGPNGSQPPLMTIQWQPQSLLETRFAAKILEDNKVLKGFLDDLAHGKAAAAETWQKSLETTYLKNPRLWTSAGWEEGWPKILPLLQKIVSGSAGISINSVSALIVHKEYDPALKDKDVDAVCKIKVTFSASEGDYVMEGSLRHMRVCPIEP